jgi:ribosome biogenesis GTPase A
MKKAKELIQKNLKLVDVVVELLDARIPMSSRNPQTDQMVGEKPRIIALNKADLADKNLNVVWINYFKKFGMNAISVNSLQGQGLDKLVLEIQRAAKPKMDSLSKKGMCKRPVRVMIIGIPNVGKSSMINRLIGKRSTKVGDRPGVTKGQQWIRLKGNIELLDTPGILWPKFENEIVGLKLAFTGSIKDEILDMETVALKFIEYVSMRYPESIQARYKLNRISTNPLENMENIAKNRGCIIAGGKIDYARVANVIIDEFRSGKLGEITLEMPNDF